MKPAQFADTTAATFLTQSHDDKEQMALLYVTVLLLRGKIEEVKNYSALAKRLGWDRKKTRYFVQKHLSQLEIIKTKKEAPLPAVQPEMIRFGERVKVRESWFEEQCRKDGSKYVRELLQKINDWCLAKGKNYKDYEAAYRNWAQKDKANNRISGRYERPKTNYEKALELQREIQEREDDRERDRSAVGIFGGSLAKV